MRINTFHRDEHAPTASLQTKMSSQSDKITQIGKSAGNNNNEFVFRVEVFNTLRHYLDIFQLQFNSRLLQKYGFFMVAFDQRDMPIRSRQSQRDAGQAGAAPDVRDTRPADVWQNRQAIEQMPHQHGFRRTYRGQIVNLIPLLN